MRASFCCRSFSRCTLLSTSAFSSACPFSTLFFQLSSCSVVLPISTENGLSVVASDWLLGDAAAASSCF